MIDIKQGLSNKAPASTELLVKFFKANSFEGKLYTGYPILYAGGESITLDALWISEQYGVIAFDLIEGNKISDRSEYRDSIFTKLKSLLSQYKELNIRRDFAVSIEVITFAPACKSTALDYTTTSELELKKIIEEKLVKWSHPELITQTISVIQSVVKLKPIINRDYVVKNDSKGAIIKKLEETIANLDNQQETAIIEYKGGIQRIRGLAGSGKTIVLALKAAYLHATNPDWNIAVTFNTRALKDQFNDLIELFCLQKTGKKPNKDKLRIIQAWGSSSNNGIYFEFCKQNSIEYLDFGTANVRNSNPKQSPFDYACSIAIEQVDKNKILPIYDVILVDEAQDLSESFLNLCFLILKKDIKGERRLIYAYDELQTLNEGYSLRNPKVIFNEEANDIILDKCYRNSRPLLTTAHALGFGIYKEGLVQFFDEPKLWSDVGYVVEKGQMVGNSDVVLSRKELATHKFLEENVKIEDLIAFKSFKSKEEQAKAIVSEIAHNLKEDELRYSDIIVINPLAQTTKAEVGDIRLLLQKQGIKSHIAGVNNPDKFFEEDSITFTGINRAKGNEVPMVYIINAQECHSHPLFKDRDLIRRRNILFTAMTRSKAWVRIFGIGSRMEELILEFNMVKEKKFKLDFIYPTPEQIERMNTIRRDITQTEEERFKKDIDILSEIPKLVERIKLGESSIEDYPESIQELLKKLVGA